MSNDSIAADAQDLAGVEQKTTDHPGVKPFNDLLSGKGDLTAISDMVTKLVVLANNSELTVAGTIQGP